MKEKEDLIENSPEYIEKLVSDAEGGNVDAQFRLASRYHDGIGLSQDFGAAVNWYKKAAGQKHPEALRKIGLAYLDGEGGDKNPNQALYYFLEAKKYYTDLDRLCGLMENIYLALDKLDRLPYEKFEMVSEFALDGKGCKECSYVDKYDDKSRGCPFFQKELGLIYYNGEYGERDYVKAAEWFRKAALQGRAFAQRMMGIIYLNGKGVERNYDEAAEWFNRAAERGESSSQFYLGLMFAKGLGVAQDDAIAVQLYRKAASQGNDNALKELGIVSVKESMEDERGVVYSSDGETLLLCKNNDIVYYSIRSGCHKIGQGAFAGIESLESIHIPDGLKEIGAYAFAGCSGISSIYLSKDIEEIGIGAFDSIPYEYVYGIDEERFDNVDILFNVDRDDDYDASDSYGYDEDNSYRDDYDWRAETWDAMTDGMYGDYNGYDGDYDFLGR